MSQSTESAEIAGSRHFAWEVVALVALFFVYAGDHAPAVNEAHYLVKAKSFWDPTWCQNDLFVSSAKAHTTFYFAFGWLTNFVSFGTTAWIGRVIGWTVLAFGLARCCRSLQLPAFFSLAVACLWITGIAHGNLAGEWVVGGIEAKVPAYGLVLAGFADVVRRQWSRAWVWFGAASAFHVLTGGWAVVASAVAFFVTERVLPNRQAIEVSPERRHFFSTGLFAGGLLALFGLVPAVWLSSGVTPEESVQAARIYSYLRIRHHLLPGDFQTIWFIRHGVLIAVFLILFATLRRDAGLRRMQWIGIGALLVALVGLALGFLPTYAPDLAAKLLRFYWFRFSDAVIPLVVALSAAKILADTNARRPILRRVAMIGAGLSVAAVGYQAQVNGRLGVPPSTCHRLLGIHPSAAETRQRQSHADWIAVCDWIRVATPEDEVFLTPRHQQTFKWYAQRAEVVNWKDVPQDAKSLIEWEKRFFEIYPRRLGTVRVTIKYATLRSYRERFGVRFMVVDNRIVGERLPLVKVYPIADQGNETYSVYELPR